ncbi:MAG: mandelate racemase [Rubrivivax sp.]|nr:mandelate racemase [Rubrivivax sp.]
MPATAPRFEIEFIRFFERDVRLRMPFRFGVVTLTEAPQAFVHVGVRLPGGGVGEGMSAELLAPKWFDKNPALSNEDNFDQLRRALALARGLYLDGTARSAFGHFAAHHRAQVERGAAGGLNPLVASYGPALVDKAVLDALGRVLGRPFHELVAGNLVGVAAPEVEPLCPDLAGFDLDAFLATLTPARSLAARHTVGLVDPIVAADQPAGSRVGDGLPETLEEVVATYGQRWFKLKVGGDVEADVARLVRIAGVLGRISGEWHCTLDGNEQYDSVEGVLRLWRRIAAEPRLAALRERVVFIEQPVKRQAALAEDVHALAALKPVIIDESDDSLDAFVRARARGYGGVSSKTCKGLYKSLLNRARCETWNAQAPGRYLMSGEDLTIQPGLALQQDLALVGLLGITHVERNGHHYVNGMADLPASEQQAFLAAHPDLYEHSHGAVRLRITDGQIEMASLAAPPGFASGAWPEPGTLRPMATP